MRNKKKKPWLQLVNYLGGGGEERGENAHQHKIRFSLVLLPAHSVPSYFTLLKQFHIVVIETFRG